MTHPKVNFLAHSLQLRKWCQLWYAAFFRFAALWKTATKIKPSRLSLLRRRGKRKVSCFPMKDQGENKCHWISRHVPISTLANLYSFETECRWTSGVLEGSGQNSFSVQFLLLLKPSFSFSLIPPLHRHFEPDAKTYPTTLIYQEPMTGRCIWPSMHKNCVP